MHCYSGISSQTVSFFSPLRKIGPFLGDACPQAPTWHEVKRSSDIRSCKWAMAADGTLIALLFAAVYVPLCDSPEHKNKAVSRPGAKIICDPHNYVGQGVWIIKEARLPWSSEKKKKEIYLANEDTGIFNFDILILNTNIEYSVLTGLSGFNFFLWDSFFP